jgi:hypothetical protein
MTDLEKAWRRVRVAHDALNDVLRIVKTVTDRAHSVDLSRALYDALGVTEWDAVRELLNEDGEEKDVFHWDERATDIERVRGSLFLAAQALDTALNALAKEA